MQGPSTQDMLSPWQHNYRLGSEWRPHLVTLGLRRGQAGRGNRCPPHQPRRSPNLTLDLGFSEAS